MAAVLCILGLAAISPKLLQVEMYTQEEWDYHLYEQFMKKAEKGIEKHRLEEIRNGRW